MRTFRLGITTLMMLLLASCARPPKVAIDHHKRDVRAIGAFSEVTAHGQVDMVFNRGSRDGQVELFGDSRDLAQVKTERIDDILYLTVPKQLPRYGRIKAVISTKYVNAIRFNGKGNVDGSRISGRDMDLIFNSKGRVRLNGHLDIKRLVATNTADIKINGIESNQMSVIMSGAPSVKLKGFAKLEKLSYGGQGDLSLHWVKSDKLDVEGHGEAKVHLAGTVKFLNTKLYNEAELDGQYLRVAKAYVKTFNHALARLQPIRQLNAIAADESNIFYYNSPKFKADYMMANGAVLNMRPFWF